MGTLPLTRRLRRKTEPHARCSGRTGEPRPERTRRTYNNGFLRHSFRPIAGLNIPFTGNTEKEFFTSLQNLCSLYQLELPDVSGIPFPLNMKKAHREVTESLWQRKGISCYILRDGSRRATLATVRRFDTNYTLYYIPLKPLSKMRQCPLMKPLAELLSLTCACLYQKTRVSYFRGYTYMRATYSTIEDWVNEEAGGEADEFSDIQLMELECLKDFGDAFHPVIKQPFDLGNYQAMITAYNRMENWGCAFADLFEEFSKLIGEYPERAVNSGIPAGYYEESEYGNIDFDQYLSFYWSGSDCLSETLFEMVNNELTESGEHAEPVAIQWFDKPQESEHFDFNYEERVFGLIIELINLLYQYDYAD